MSRIHASSSGARAVDRSTCGRAGSAGDLDVGGDDGHRHGLEVGDGVATAAHVVRASSTSAAVSPRV